MGVDLFYTKNPKEYEVFKKLKRQQFRCTFAHATAISERQLEESKADPALEDEEDDI